MEPYEILITKENYDEEAKKTLTPQIIFAGRIFAFNQKNAAAKAIIKSGLPADAIDEVDVFVQGYSRA